MKQGGSFEPPFVVLEKMYIFATVKSINEMELMQLNNMNEAQMMILESFAGATDEQEINDLMDLLRKFYARRLEREMNRLWNDGTLNQEVLDRLKDEHLRTPYTN